MEWPEGIHRRPPILGIFVSGKSRNKGSFPTQRNRFMYFCLFVLEPLKDLIRVNLLIKQGKHQQQ